MLSVAERDVLNIVLEKYWPGPDLTESGLFKHLLSY